MFQSRFAQQAPPTASLPSPAIHIDLSGLAESIWTWFIDHIGELGMAILVALEDTLRTAARALWDALWHSSANIVTQIPPDLSYNFGPYRAVATDPVRLAVGGATLALVLLGLRTMMSAVVGTDHLVTHVLTRLIPAVFMSLAYPALIARGMGLVNSAAEALGSEAIARGFLTGFDSLAAFEPPPSGMVIPYLLLWLLLIYFGIRLLCRVAYGLFRLLVALIFSPVALILWAIPQTEWVTWFWLRELLGWATTPLLVTACLAMAIPLAGGREGFLGAMVFGIAGMQAAYDLVGLLGGTHRSTNLLRSAFSEVLDVGQVVAAETRAVAAIRMANARSAEASSRSRYGHN
jgi:hypothetical protein